MLELLVLLKARLVRMQKQQWKKYDKERPDYDQYTSKLKVRAQIDLQLSEEERKE